MTRLEAENILEANGHNPRDFMALWHFYQSEHERDQRMPRTLCAAFRKVLGEEGYIF